MLRANVTVISLGVAVGYLTACRPTGSARDGVTTKYDTVGKIVRVTNSGTPPRWRAERLAVIGSDSSEGPDQFGYIANALIDTAGTVYVLDGVSKQIRIFDKTGKHLESVGRDGAGPGEFKSPYNMAWLGDTLAVLDQATARIGLVGRDGTWFGQWVFSTRFTGAAAMSSTSINEFYVMNTYVDDTTTVYRKVTRAGPGDSVLVHQQWNARKNISITCKNDKSVDWVVAPGVWPVGNTLGPNGASLRVQAEQYRLTLIGPQNDTLRTIDRIGEPAPITDSEWAAFEAAVKKKKDEMGSATCNSIDRIANKNRLKGVFLDGEGRIWTMTITKSGIGFEVFAPDGKLLGEIPMPSLSLDTYVQNINARGSYLVLVGASEEGMGHRISIYRFEPAGN